MFLGKRKTVQATDDEENNVNPQKDIPEQKSPKADEGEKEEKIQKKPENKPKSNIIIKKSVNSEETTKKRAWVDSFSDEMLVEFQGKKIKGNEYESYLRQEYLKSFVTPAWASDEHLAKIRKIEDKTISSLVQTTQSLLDTKVTGAVLPKETLDYSVMQDVTKSDVPEQGINDMHSYPLRYSNMVGLLTGEKYSTFRLYQINETLAKDNKEGGCKMISKTDNLQKKFSLRSFCFLQQSATTCEEIVATDHRSSSFVIHNFAKNITDVLGNLSGNNSQNDEFSKLDYSASSNLIAFCSTNGFIKLVSGQNKLSVADLQMKSSVTDVKFSRDGNYLFTAGAKGYFYVWDLRKNEPLSIQMEPGSMDLTAMDVCDSYLANGSVDGIVSLYSVPELIEKPQETVKALKMIKNLSTRISCLKFNPDNQILGMSSNMKDGASRLVHLPSFQVFKNFMPKRTVDLIDFSPSSGYVMCKQQKIVGLYRLKHFPAQ